MWRVPPSLSNRHSISFCVRACLHASHLDLTHRTHVCPTAPRPSCAHTSARPAPASSAGVHSILATVSACYGNWPQRRSLSTAPPRVRARERARLLGQHLDTIRASRHHVCLVFLLVGMQFFRIRALVLRACNLHLPSAAEVSPSPWYCLLLYQCVCIGYHGPTDTLTLG
jgi:hypothetical protein